MHQDLLRLLGLGLGRHQLNAVQPQPIERFEQGDVFFGGNGTVHGSMVRDRAQCAAMTQQHLIVDGIDVWIEGEGAQTVLMLHGWPDTLHLWDAQVAALRGAYRCARFTLPGFDVAGPSRETTLAGMAALVRRIADAVSPEAPLILLVHDWGAVFGYEFAAQHPSRVARLIAVDIGDIQRGAFLRSLTVQAKLMIAAYQGWLAIAWGVGRWLSTALGTRMTRSMARALRCRADPARITWQMNYPYKHQWTGGYRQATPFEPHCPVLYIYGRRKPFQFQSPQWLERIAALPGSAVQGMDTGHWVMVQQPEAFNACVLNWLKSGHADRAAS